MQVARVDARRREATDASAVTSRSTASAPARCPPFISTARGPSFMQRRALARHLGFVSRQRRAEQRRGLGEIGGQAIDQRQQPRLHRFDKARAGERVARRGDHDGIVDDEGRRPFPLAGEGGQAKPGRMRGRAARRASRPRCLAVATDPSSVAFGDTFSRKGRGRRRLQASRHRLDDLRAPQHADLDRRDVEIGEHRVDLRRDDRRRREWIARTPSVFCAVIAVIALAP